jgi:hypothetical protein
MKTEQKNKLALTNEFIELYLGGCTLAEVASASGISPMTVRRKLAAIGALRTPRQAIAISIEKGRHTSCRVS